MKKLVLLCIGILSMSITYAQGVSDALRYSQSDIQGTARFKGLSGAFGALGGDLSATSINPAGAAVFSKSHASFTLSVNDLTNESLYFDGLNSTNDSNFGLQQGGAVFVFKSNDTNNPWKKFTVGLNFERTNNFNDNWNATGTNNFGVDNFDNTIASYFFDYANGLPLGDISAFDNESLADAYFNIGQASGFGYQQAFLGFESFILEPGDVNDDNNTEYFINMENGNFRHDYSYLSTGFNGKVGANFAVQYGEILFLGASLNHHFLEFERSKLLKENSPAGSLVSRVEFEDNLSTTGSGFSFQLGGIVKLNQLRLGLAYDSPTWYIIQEESTQYLETTISGSPSETIIINPNVINVFPDYRIKTPGKVTGSIAYIFGKKGLLSFDYSRKDYSSTKFGPSQDYTFENNDLNNMLKVASTYRLGAEIKAKQLSFRGGYRIEESPYNNEVIVGDLTGFSLGVGYNFTANTRLDIAYDQSQRTNQTALFNRGLIDPSNNRPYKL